MRDPLPGDLGFVRRVGGSRGAKAVRWIQWLLKPGDWPTHVFVFDYDNRLYEAAPGGVRSISWRDELTEGVHLGKLRVEVRRLVDRDPARVDAALHAMRRQHPLGEPYGYSYFTTLWMIRRGVICSVVARTFLEHYVGRSLPTIDPRRRGESDGPTSPVTSVTRVYLCPWLEAAGELVWDEALEELVLK